MIDTYSFVRTLTVMLVAGTAVNLSLNWARRRARLRRTASLNIQVRPFTFWELAIGMLPIAVFIAGVFGSFDVIEFMGGGTLKLSNALFYTGIVFLLSLAIPLLVARLCGKAFYDGFLLQGEARGDPDLRTTAALVGAVGGAFLLSAGVFYVIDYLQ